MKVYLILGGLLAINLAYSQKNLVLQDKTYEPQIKTVRLYPNQPTEGNTILPAVTRVDVQNLMLEFDDLQEERNNYYARVIHCNFDWSKSTLMDLDYMRDYNEFPINDYSFSINTHVPYVHYRFAIPTVKLPGNYVLIVYRDGNKQDLVLSWRFAVNDSRIALTQDSDLSGLGNIRSTNQALNFVLSYRGIEVINPAGSIHVVVRQNQRWDNAKYDVQPSFLREDVSELEYRFFDMDKTFSGGNEFRFVDFRSLNYPGQNTYKLDRSHKPFDLVVALDAPRGSQAYSQYPDMNGNFTIDNQDIRSEPWISSNYVYVNFGLQSPPIKGDVYVVGAFNGWQRTSENKLAYDQGIYAQRILLKQGFYNYQYWVDAKGADANQVEGNYFQTENLYEVFVYYRPFQPNADLLLGYFVIPVNPR
ncbi:MAG: DUF5103 domain-containing protein [Cyclobacteriaceae bacterium]|nr:DUF5103 domain-containing protein [Cyclobacteriaceae bacterium]